MASYLGTFLLGDDTGSYLGLSPTQAIMPRLIIRTKALALPEGETRARADIVFEPQHDFSLPFTLSAEGPDGFSEFGFSPGSGKLTASSLSFTVGAVPFGLYAVMVKATTADETYTAPLLVSVVPDAFCVIDGIAVPVVENGFDETSEPLGSSARSRDGALISTVRGYKRTWKFRTEPLPSAEYQALAAALFNPKTTYRVLSGEIVFGQAVKVELTPDPPDVFTANDRLRYYRLAASMQEV